MKKIIALVCSLIAFASLSLAQTMDSRTFTLSHIGTNVASQSFVLRGELQSVYVDVTANKTQTVAVASAFGTALSQSFTADAVRYPRVQLQSTAGTDIISGTTSNTAFGKFPMAGAITVTVTPAANSTGTNTTAVTVIYKP